VNPGRDDASAPVPANPPAALFFRGWLSKFGFKARVRAFAFCGLSTEAAAYFNELLIEANLVLKLRAQPVHDRNYRKRNANCDKPVPSATTHIGPARTRNGI
jgi:hypothetical protein